MLRGLDSGLRGSPRRIVFVFRPPPRCASARLQSATGLWGEVPAMAADMRCSLKCDIKRTVVLSWSRIREGMSKVLARQLSSTGVSLSNSQELGTLRLLFVCVQVVVELGGPARVRQHVYASAATVHSISSMWYRET